MKVRLAGFTLTLHPKLTFANLYAEMAKKGGTGRFKFHGHDRVLSVAKDDDRILGSLLTDRGHKNFLAINTQTNAITAGTLGQNKNFGAFNFFVLCPKKSTALITCYQDAGGPSFVFGVLDSLGTELLRGQQKAALAALPPEATKAAKEKVLSAHETPSLTWTEILGQAQFDAVLKEWEKIRAVEVVYAKPEDAPAFVPKGANAPIGHTTVRLAFERGTKIDAAVKYVKSLWKSDEAKKAETVRVDGVDEWGIARRVELRDQIPSLFGDIDHDEIVAEQTSFQADLKSAYVIRKLREVINDSPGIFG